MKYLSLLTYLIAFLGKVTVMTQAPNKINYQAVARDAAGMPLMNQGIKLRLSIRQDAPDGPVQYTETRSITTNSLGLFSMAIGDDGASDVTGSVAFTSWNSGDKFLKVEIDPNGGSSFADMGTSQLLSVPFALNRADNQWLSNGPNISNKHCCLHKVCCNPTHIIVSNRLIMMVRLAIHLLFMLSRLLLSGFHCIPIQPVVCSIWRLRRAAPRYILSFTTSMAAKCSKKHIYPQV
ncbi:MAG: hypothetical protein ABIN80_15225 [Dyadobacter sp.]|uniref:hypothetical protein n=1 Tax=Dyadobacter sp. TaxID=1914288 RepID=UPI0032659151